MFIVRFPDLKLLVEYLEEIIEEEFIVYFVPDIVGELLKDLLFFFGLECLCPVLLPSVLKVLFNFTSQTGFEWVVTIESLQHIEKGF
jgi:hypothetical protein